MPDTDQAIFTHQPPWHPPPSVSRWPLPDSQHFLHNQPIHAALYRHDLEHNRHLGAGRKSS
ncbi:hypothetical protein FUT69_01165 [Xylella taiwanensis]|uniref:Uncharacterized protein n=1 Tax=Xylella taiwanensis TaxID=1444770 RepID=A0ABS8TTG3_9GAMM|nr:hypothetical protein [Xylella taiwanensis]MCD8456080.1 hypothetical protein [Xylella taiwanensis]MCD8458485.1 hypothetical protein [Xylella taiwanensis]MCD8460620.1 hypothetical protein [Xylella taiwanensis]MCD8463318.1 hypothetical protein [Xylella taiwanensis]MCD8465125.1 hypothetical protein [Xylella taiwanensis]